MRLYLKLSFLLICLVSFQNCSKSNFSTISAAEKTGALESHGGLSSDSDKDDRPSSGTTPTNNAVLSPRAPCELYKIENCEYVKNGVYQTDSGRAVNDIYNGSDTVRAVSGKEVTVLLHSRDIVPNVHSSLQRYLFMGFDEPGTDIGLVQTERWCRGANSGNALLEATQATLLVKYNDRVICSRTTSVLSELLNQKNIDLTGCRLTGIPDGSAISIHIVDQNGVNLVYSERVRSGRILKVPLLVQNNITEQAMDSRCEKYMQSPLVIDMRDEEALAVPIALTAPEEGVYFDIMGLNSTPTAHTPKRISWFKDPRVMPLVLEKNGRVDGINELFGNNTMGPDGAFAADGFHALAKYDGLNLATNKTHAKDGLIDSNDEVYQFLKLWHDRNQDGVAEADELLSLQELGVEVIDLNFDPNYFSTDHHGNEIKYKSVVKMKDSKKLRPIFDIWFLVDETIQ